MTENLWRFVWLTLYKMANKNRTFLRYHISAVTTDMIMRFLLKCSEITAENNKRYFFKQALNILCTVTGNGLRHTGLLDDDQPGLGWHCHRPVLKTTYPGHSCWRWTYWASPYTDCDKTLWHTSKLILLETLLALTFTRYHILTSLQRILNTRFKKLSLVVFCCNFWTLQQKPRDYIITFCRGYKDMVSQKCAVFIGPPPPCIYLYTVQ